MANEPTCCETMRDVRPLTPDSGIDSKSDEKMTGDFLAKHTPVPQDLSAQCQPVHNGNKDVDSTDFVKMTIRMPDLFASIMATDVHLNPHYASIKARSDAYITQCVSSRGCTIFDWECLTRI